MSIIVCKDWSELSPEEIEAELDRNSDLYTFNDVLKIDCLKISDKLTKTWDRINSILGGKSGNSAAAAKLKELYVKTRFQAACTELFFKEPPRSECEGARGGPIACVYDKSGNLSYVNNAYLSASGLVKLVEDEPEKWKQIIGEKRFADKTLTLMDHVKFLAKETVLVKQLANPQHPDGIHVSKLYLLLYSPETIKRIYIRFEQLNTKGGYEDVFQMKLTGKHYLWKTLENKQFKGNIRSAIEVTKDHPLIIRAQNEKNGIPTKTVHVNNFGFYQTIDKFRRTCDMILKGKVDNSFAELMQFAVFGDTFVDESFYATKGWDGFNYYINRQYVINSAFTTSDQVEYAINNGQFNALYYGKSSNNLTKNYLNQLLKESGGHYNETFSPQIRKVDDTHIERSDINFDTFLIKGPDYIDSDKRPDKYFQIGALQKTYLSYT